jgi:hypothetical protein
MVFPRKSLWIALACVLFAGLAAPAQQFEASDEQELVRLLNEERANAGLPQLEVDERLTKVARLHSRLMAEKMSLSHQFAGEPELRQRIATTTLRFNNSAENVAYDATAPEAHSGLMHSPPHRENILSPRYNAVGIGVVRRGAMVYVTQDFARRLPEVSLDTAEQTIARAFADLRQSGGEAPLPLRPLPELRHFACDMAAHDALDARSPGKIPGVHDVVVYTATELERLPGNMQKLKNQKASGYSLGACLSKSASYPNAVYWVVVVTYF